MQRPVCHIRGLLTKHPLIIDVFNTVPHADREGTGENVQVKEKGNPGGGLVLGHGRDDRDVYFGVARVPQGVEPSTPRMDIP